MGKIRWLKALRQIGAVCLAALATWMLALGAVARAVTGAVGDAAAGAVEVLGGEEKLVTAALAVELGADPGGGLPFWQRLAVDQSPLLRANPYPSEDRTGQAGAEEAGTLPDARPAPDHDDLAEEPPIPAVEPGDIRERTLIPTTSQGYDMGGGLYLYNRTDLAVDLTKTAARPVGFSLAPAGEGPQILIIHTHTTEAYTPDGEDVYVPSDENTRTLDQSCNIVRVGDEMERVFAEMGLGVVHDRGLYDYPKYAGSYTRSGPAVEDYLERYPTIRIVLDVHRDALVGSDGTVYKAVTEIDGTKTAQVMLVVGTDAGGTEHPDWEENLTLACKLQKALDTLYPTLARPMTLRQSAYNQNLSPGSLLVEVGSHGNTLREALAGARCFARAAGMVCLGLVEEGT